MKFILSVAVFCSVAAKIALLTQDIYLQHLSKRHLFVVACTQADLSCNKVQDDFEEEWKRFDKQNKKDFDSALFVLIKTNDNADFFATFTKETNKHIILYLEEGEQEQKQIIDPFATSQKALRDWLREIEIVYADKKINEKIEELDIMINNLKDPAYLANMARAHPLQEEADILQDLKNSQRNIPSKPQSESSKDSAVSANVSPSGDNLLGKSVSETLSSANDSSQTSVAKEDENSLKLSVQASVLASVLEAAKQTTFAGSEPVEPEAAELKLQSKIDDEEVANLRERNLNIHEVKVKSLDNKEQELVKEYLQEVIETKKNYQPVSSSIKVQPIVSPQPSLLTPQPQPTPSPSQSQTQSTPPPSQSQSTPPPSQSQSTLPSSQSQSTPPPSQSQSIPLPQKSQSTPSASQSSLSTLNPSTNSQLPVPKVEEKRLSAEDIDLTKLTPREAEIVIKYINDRRIAEKKRKEQYEAFLTQKETPETKEVVPVSQAPTPTKVVNLTTVSSSVKPNPSTFLTRLRVKSLSQSFFSSFCITVAALLGTFASAVTLFLLLRRKRGYVPLNKKHSRIEDI